MARDDLRWAACTDDCHKPLDAPAPSKFADQEWFTTAQAAEYLETTAKALLWHVYRGNLVPDSWGSRGRMRSHRFSRRTLDAFLRGAG